MKNNHYIMKDLKQILERKDDSIVTLPRWAKFIYIDLEKEQIEFLTTKETPKDIKDKAARGEGIINDEDNIAHQGFDALLDYIDKKPPKILLHGHTYPNEENMIRQHGPTKIEYTYGYQIIEI